MKKYKHILVATDLKKDSDAVIERGVNFAKNSSAELSLAHIIEFSPIIYGGGEFAIPLDGDIEASIHEQALKTINQQAARYNIPKDHLYLETGDAAVTLHEIVKKTHADLLILGSHMRGALGFLMGSTANSMLHSMPCDVLAVRV